MTEWTKGNSPPIPYIPLCVYSDPGHGDGMELIKIYECLCDRTRLRILNLLLQGPLCVCHFQEILREPQVKISKHLGYLKRNGLVQAERCANMTCLQDCAHDERLFREDTARLAKARAKFGPETPACVREPGAGCAD
jgi:ArsR family transcriptional regulator